MEKLSSPTGDAAVWAGHARARGAGADAAGSRYGVLDGWRGVSILLVLAAHLLPLGPKPLQLNFAAGVLGMVFFFVLSGFLITTLLLQGMALREFVMRRLFRILPLAWLFLAIALTAVAAPVQSWFAHFLFYANLPPVRLVPVTGHMWSVCMEMQFYAGIAVLAAVLGRRGLLLLPVACVLFTLLRVANGAHASSVSYFRIDEILAGCTLALVYHHPRTHALRRLLAASPQWALAVLLVASSLVQGGWLNYLRPYFGAALVGATLLNPRAGFGPGLGSRVLAYLAAVSYALYVIHPLLAASWLGSGDIVEKYAKRPLLIAVLFSLAHLSTYHYEQRWIAAGKALAARLRARTLPGGPSHAP